MQIVERLVGYNTNISTLAPLILLPSSVGICMASCLFLHTDIGMADEGVPHSQSTVCAGKGAATRCVKLCHTTDASFAAVVIAAFQQAPAYL